MVEISSLHYTLTGDDKNIIALNLSWANFLVLDSAYKF